VPRNSHFLGAETDPDESLIKARNMKVYGEILGAKENDK
jgi:hypothetical protein